MKKFPHISGVLLTSLLVVFVAAGCGEDPVDVENGDNANGGEVENNDNPNNSNGSEDCADDEFYHPVRNECVKNDENQNNQNNQNQNNQNQNNQNQNNNDLNDPDPDCEDGEIVHPDSGECVDEEEFLEQCGPGDIDGQTCRPDGGVLPGAEVTVEGYDCEGNHFTESTSADGEGYYYFEDIDSGEHELTIETGSFSVTDDVLVVKDQVTNLKGENSKVCLQGTEVEIAVIIGTWDDIPSLLNGMNIQHDIINPGGGNADAVANFLSDIDAMNEYDIIFVECNSPWDFSSFSYNMEDIKNNVRTYIEMGNSLYASDYAYDYVQDSMPGVIKWYNEETGGAPTSGTAGEYPVDVVSDDMLTLLGTSTTDINFNLGGWAIAEDGGPGTTVHFRSQAGSDCCSGVEEAALMTTYHDLIGDGRLIYTSFHNSAQVSGDMQQILEFMIFQL